MGAVTEESAVPPAQETQMAGEAGAIRIGSDEGRASPRGGEGGSREGGHASLLDEMNHDEIEGQLDAELRQLQPLPISDDLARQGQKLTGGERGGAREEEGGAGDSRGGKEHEKAPKAERDHILLGQDMGGVQTMEEYVPTGGRLQEKEDGTPFGNGGEVEQQQQAGIEPREAPAAHPAVKPGEERAEGGGNDGGRMEPRPTPLDAPNAASHDAPNAVVETAVSSEGRGPVDVSKGGVKIDPVHETEQHSGTVRPPAAPLLSQPALFARPCPHTALLTSHMQLPCTGRGRLRITPRTTPRGLLHPTTCLLHLDCLESRHYRRQQLPLRPTRRRGRLHRHTATGWRLRGGLLRRRRGWASVGLG